MPWYLVQQDTTSIQGYCVACALLANTLYKKNDFARTKEFNDENKIHFSYVINNM